MRATQFLSELSTELLARYKKAASADASKADKEGDYERANKRFKGINKATIKQFDNDAKSHKLDEKSTTEKQARFMAAAAHDPQFAARAGIKQSVAKEFNKADTGTKQLSNAMKHKPKKKALKEMDSQQPSGRLKSDGTRSHSTYGSRDNDNGSNGPDIHLGPKHIMKKKDVVKAGSKALDKAFNNKVQDRKTGRMYDPDEEFNKIMNSPEVKAQMKRMAAKEGVAEGSMSPDEYKQKLLNTIPRMMDFYEKNVKGWKPSEEQMLAAVETGYIVMKRTGDVQQAGKAVMDELNTLHKMSQGQQGVAEGEVVKFPKKHRSDLDDTHDCPKCGGDLQGGKYMGHQVKVCMPCKQVYLPPNSGIDRKGNKVDEIAGAFPTPSQQKAMYAASAQSNRAQAAELQRQNNAARAARLDTATKDLERLNKVNFHGANAPKPTNASWDGDSDFLDMDGTKYNRAFRMPISGDEPKDMKLIATREGRQVYIWTRNSLKGVVGRYFYPANPVQEAMDAIGQWLAEEGKASRALCTSSKPDDELGASQLASCKSQGLRARDGEKSHLIGHRGSKVRVTVGGKKIKGRKYGGPLPDYGTRKSQL